MIPKIEKGRTTSHRVQKWLCKGLWTCLKTDYAMNDVTGLLTAN